MTLMTPLLHCMGCTNSGNDLVSHSDTKRSTKHPRLPTWPVQQREIGELFASQGPSGHGEVPMVTTACSTMHAADGQGLGSTNTPRGVPLTP